MAVRARGVTNRVGSSRRRGRIFIHGYGCGSDPFERHPASPIQKPAELEALSFSSEFKLAANQLPILVPGLICRLRASAILRFPTVTHKRHLKEKSIRPCRNY